MPREANSTEAITAKWLREIGLLPGQILDFIEEFGVRMSLTRANLMQMSEMEIYGFDEMLKRMMSGDTLRSFMEALDFAKEITNQRDFLRTIAIAAADCLGLPHTTEDHPMTSEPTLDDQDNRIAALKSELTAAKDDLNRTLDLCEGMDDYLQEHHNFVLNILRNALGLTETASVYSMAKEIRRLKRMEECR